MNKKNKARKYLVFFPLALSSAMVAVSCNDQLQNEKLIAQSKIDAFEYIKAEDKEKAKKDINLASSKEAIETIVNNLATIEARIKNKYLSSATLLKELKLDPNLKSGEISNLISTINEIHGEEAFKKYLTNALTALKTFYVNRINANIETENKSAMINKINQAKTLEEVDAFASEYAKVLKLTFKNLVNLKSQELINKVNSLTYLELAKTQDYASKISNLSLDETKLNSLINQNAYLELINLLNEQYRLAQEANLNAITKLIEQILSDEKFSKNKKDEINKKKTENKSDLNKLIDLLTLSEQTLLNDYQSYIDSYLDKVENNELKTKLIQLKEENKTIRALGSISDLVAKSLVKDKVITHLKNHDFKGINKTKEELINLISDINNLNSFNEFSQIFKQFKSDFNFANLKNENLVNYLANLDLANLSSLKNQYNEAKNALYYLNNLDSLAENDALVQLKTNLSAQNTLVNQTEDQDLILTKMQKLNDLEKEAIKLTIFNAIPTKLINLLNKNTIDSIKNDIDTKITNFNNFNLNQFISLNVLPKVTTNINEYLTGLIANLQNKELKDSLNEKNNAVILNFDALVNLLSFANQVMPLDASFEELKSSEFEYLSDAEKTQIINDILNSNNFTIDKNN
ncbi:UNVERIFIED_CONTAM: hypothetical protein O8I53_08615 [Campylobacter lari]